ncbi:hypothetical protein [Aquincola tertiaricarbonis]|uniref:hypothetical protein n=1 Tax=Aquincola tertiaricarbonis TaxID=391953 RepID=UPI0012ED1A43|nr:hypothetical protein [Aquincola tertiaricarbonis]
MDTSARDRITVDLQGLKAALVARSQAEGLMPSQLVRQALAACLGTNPASTSLASGSARRQRSKRLCLRMRPEEVRAVMSSAARAGQSPGRWLAALASGAPSAADAQQVEAQRQALVSMTAELAALRRTLHRMAGMNCGGPALAECEAVNQVVIALNELLVSIARQAPMQKPSVSVPLRRVNDGRRKRRPT